MSLINIQNLTFAYDGSYDNVFENVSFSIDSNWRLGFTGRNGRGKTTFMRLLMGMYEYSGTISSSIPFDYFPYEVDLSSTAFEAVQNKVPDAEIWEIERELSLLGVSEDALWRPLDTLSNGERTKILLAALFLKKNNFLLIDEPTNHLDTEGRELLSKYLERQKGFILVSHDRTFLDNSIDHILVLNRKNIDIFKGNFSTWQLEKDRADNYELQQNAKLKKEISRLSSAAAKTANWSDKVEKSKIGAESGGVRADKGYIGHKAAKMMQRSKNIQKRREEQIEEKAGLLHNIESSEDLKIHPLTFHTNNFMEFVNVSAGYGEKTVLRDISFDIKSGDRLAIVGGNGSGKSTLIKMICGEKESSSGEIHKNNRLIISYVPQSTEGLSGSFEDYIHKYQIDESLFKAILRKLDFSRTQFEKDISNLSEGQKKKIHIARSLCEKAHLYVWDEPLNYIDVISRIQIERLILDFEPTLVFVEHDKTFCDKIATKRVNL